MKTYMHLMEFDLNICVFSLHLLRKTDKIKYFSASLKFINFVSFV